MICEDMPGLSRSLACYLGFRNDMITLIGNLIRMNLIMGPVCPVASLPGGECPPLRVNPRLDPCSTTGPLAQPSCTAPGAWGGNPSLVGALS